MSSKVPVGILGTGMVGQRFLQALADHPHFELVEMIGRSSVGNAATDGWVLPEAPPRAFDDLVVTDAVRDAQLVFSALPSDAARKLEPSLAGSGVHVFTNASPHRMHPDVPLLIGDVNPDHLGLVAHRSWPGALVANPNCSAIVLTTALAPLHRAFTATSADVVTLQALSGAGYPGVPSLDAVGNVIPLIRNEEDKIETEPCRILGDLTGDGIEPADIHIRATATRVPVAEGHTVAAHVRFAEAPGSADAVLDAFRQAPPGAVEGLPSLTAPGVVVTDRDDGPQPRRDAMAGGGMTVTVGRVRVEGDAVRFVCHGSNTVRGAAGCSVLNAELAHAQGFLDG